MKLIEIAAELRDCLCGFLIDTLGGAVCRCSLYPSGDIPFDICTNTADGNGQAAVALVRTYPTLNFPIPITGGDVRCDYYLAAEFRLSVVRCAPTLGSTGKLPSPEALDLAAEILAGDANAVRCAVTCCLDRRPFQILEWRSYPVQGGCMGGELSVLIQTDDVACFQESSS